MSDTILFYDKGDSFLLSMISRKVFSGKGNVLKAAFDFIYDKLSDDELKYLGNFGMRKIKILIKTFIFPVLDSNTLSHLPVSLILRTRILPNSKGEIEPIFFVVE